MKVGMGMRRIYFKKAPVYSSSFQRCGQPTAVTVTVEQSCDRLQSSREAVENGSWWRYVALPLIIPHAGGAHCQQESVLQSRRSLDMTFVDEICKVAETKTTYITDKLN